MSTDPLCHYCFDKSRAENPVIGWLVHVGPGGYYWRLAVCERHARARSTPVYQGGRVLLQRLGDPDPTLSGQPCGAYATVEWHEGSRRVERWCDRLDGPCPFPGADRREGRPCAAALEERLAAQLTNMRRMSGEAVTP